MKKYAFSIVELLIVVIIIGVLATLAIPGFTTSREKTFDRVAQAKLREMVAEAEMLSIEQKFTGLGTCTSSATCAAMFNLELSASEWAFRVDNSTGTLEFEAIRNTNNRRWHFNASMIRPVCTTNCL